MKDETTTLELQETKPAAVVKAAGQPVEKRASAMQVMAERMSVEPAKLLDTLKQTVFKGASNEELLALVVVANEYGLNPFLKELYAFPAKGGGIVPVVSVDGWIKLINQQPKFGGIEFEFQDDEAGHPYSCTCRIYIEGRSKPVSVTEFYAECARKSEPWDKLPRRMLRHRALIQCGRVAFGFSGITDEDEAQGFDNARHARVVSVETKRPEFGKLEAAAVKADGTAI
jgi:phage recombination protein Bet